MEHSNECTESEQEPLPGEAFALPIEVRVTPPPGIYHNVPLLEYLKWDAASFHRLKDLGRSPAHCAFNIDSPQVSTQAMIDGDLIHKLVLQPEIAKKAYRVAPNVDRRTKGGKADWNEFVSSCPEDVTVVKEAQWFTNQKIARTVREHKNASLFLVDADYVETSLVWNCRLTGTLCKARIDACKLELETLADLKSCQDASPYEFPRTIANFKYAHQMAFYLHAMSHFPEFKTVKHAVLVAVEKEAPYGVAVYRLLDEDLKKAWEEVEPLLKLYNYCQQTARWPSYSSDVLDAVLPPWTFRS